MMSSLIGMQLRQDDKELAASKQKKKPKKKPAQPKSEAVLLMGITTSQGPTQHTGQIPTQSHQQPLLQQPLPISNKPPPPAVSTPDMYKLPQCEPHLIPPHEQPSGGIRYEPPLGQQHHPPQGPRYGPQQCPRPGPPQDPRHGLPRGPRQGTPQGPRHGSRQGPRPRPPKGPRYGPAQGPRHEAAHGPYATQGPDHATPHGSIHGPPKGSKQESSITEQQHKDINRKDESSWASTSPQKRRGRKTGAQPQQVSLKGPTPNSAMKEQTDQARNKTLNHDIDTPGTAARIAAHPNKRDKQANIQDDVAASITTGGLLQTKELQDDVKLESKLDSTGILVQSTRTKKRRGKKTNAKITTDRVKDEEGSRNTGDLLQNTELEDDVETESKTDSPETAIQTAAPKKRRGKKTKIQVNSDRVKDAEGFKNTGGLQQDTKLQDGVKLESSIDTIGTAIQTTRSKTKRGKRSNVRVNPDDVTNTEGLIDTGGVLQHNELQEVVQMVMNEEHISEMSQLTEEIEELIQTKVKERLLQRQLDREANRSGSASNKSSIKARGGKRSQKEVKTSAGAGNVVQDDTKTNPVLPDADVVFKWMVKYHEGKCTLGKLLEEPELIPAGINAIQWFNKSRRFKVFLCKRKSDVNKSLVKVHSKQIRMCAYYNKMGVCHNKNCPFVHLCRYYLAGECTNTECSFAHTLLDDHNRRVAKQLAGIYTDYEIIHIMRNSTLQICHEYNQGSCPAEDDFYLCHKLHMCAAFICRRCPLSDQECTKEHSFEKNTVKNILAMYQLSGQKENLVGGSILVTGYDRSVSGERSAVEEGTGATAPCHQMFGPITTKPHADTEVKSADVAEVDGAKEMDYDDEMVDDDADDDNDEEEEKEDDDDADDYDENYDNGDERGASSDQVCEEFAEYDGAEVSGDDDDDDDDDDVDAVDDDDETEEDDNDSEDYEDGYDNDDNVDYENSDSGDAVEDAADDVVDDDVHDQMDVGGDDLLIDNDNKAENDGIDKQQMVTDCGSIEHGVQPLDMQCSDTFADISDDMDEDSWMEVYIHNKHELCICEDNLERNCR